MAARRPLPGRLPAAARLSGLRRDGGAGTMKALRQVTGRAAVLDRADVDTDQIIPKQFLKRIERSGYGEFLFYDWMKDPAFELRRPEYEGAPDPRRRAELRLRLLARARRLGARGRRLPGGAGAELRRHLPDERDQERARADRARRGRARAAQGRRSQVRNELTVDLEALEISHPDGLRIAFAFDPFARHMLRERARRGRADARSARIESPPTSRRTRRASTRPRSSERSGGGCDPGAATGPAGQLDDLADHEQRRARRGRRRGGRCPRARRAPARPSAQVPRETTAAGVVRILAGADQAVGDPAGCAEAHEHDERARRRGELGEVEVPRPRPSGPRRASPVPRRRGG